MMSLMVPAVGQAAPVAAKEMTAEAQEQRMDKFVSDLMSKMTLEEKLGQINLPAYGDVSDPKNSDVAARIRKGEVGGLFNLRDGEVIRALQEVAVKESRLGIPMIIGGDICNGYKTVFPIPLALSSSWKPENVEEVARISAREVTADGVCWTYSPMVDIARDARWGRVKEGAGEDPYLGGLMAAAWVRGYQGDNLADETTMMACVKHFALYGASEAGRDYNTVDMSRVTAMNYYLRPFVVVSDYTAIAEMVNHGIGDLQTAAAQALKAGVDMDMIADCYTSTLKQSLADGKVTMADIDRACRYVLEAKYKLGLFDDPFRYCDKKRAEKEFRSEANLAAARRIAAETFVLLKNDGNVLPLTNCKKVAVVGPLADSKANMSGAWEYDEKTKTYNGLVENLRKAMGKNVEITFAKGANLVADATYESHFTDRNRSTRDNRTDEELIAEALKSVEGADVIVMAMGESASMSGEGASRAILEMPATQHKLIEAMHATGKPVVMVLFTGRPLALQAEEPLVDAILNVWFGGTESGAAIADVLTGKVNPTAKLTMTFPLVTGQCPIYYNHKNTGRPMAPENWFVRYQSNYIDVPNEPLYPFGYGLSYTTYAYGDVKLSADSMTADGKIQASIDVTNTGNRDGEEIVQLYLRDVYRTVTPPVKELKGYQRVALKAGETKTVTFDIDVEMLKFYNSELKHVAEPGEFRVMIGGNSQDVKENKFILK